MEESKSRQIIIEPPMDYTVTIPVMSPFRLKPDPLEAPSAWCVDNTKGAWVISGPIPVIVTDQIADLADLTAPPTEIQHYTGSYSFTFRFERDDDAALFKLFWSDGAR